MDKTDDIIRLTDLAKSMHKKLKLDRVKSHQAALHIMDSYRAAIVNQITVSKIVLPVLGIIKPTYQSAEKYLSNSDQNQSMTKQLEEYLEKRKRDPKKRVINIVKKLYATHGLHYDGRKTLGLSPGETPRDLQQEDNSEGGISSG